MDKWMTVWPVVLFFLGGVAAQFTGWLNYRRQRADRAADDAAVAKQRREEFELAHLVEVNQLLRQTAEAIRELNATKGVYGKRQEEGRPTYEHQQELANAISAFRDAVGAVDAQRGFVLADSVRDATVAARHAVDRAFSDLMTDRPFPNADLNSALANAYEQLSARVRDIYAGQSSVGAARR